MTYLFESGDFVSHSGMSLEWKIECDALADDEWALLASLVAKRIAFGAVVGVPRGGLRFSQALRRYVAEEGPRLIVDDVLTTGRSMETMREHPTDVGVVLFARGPCPDWIVPIFRLHEAFR